MDDSGTPPPYFPPLLLVDEAPAAPADEPAAAEVTPDLPALFEDGTPVPARTIHLEEENPAS